jgi:hypothetical protein
MASLAVRGHFIAFLDNCYPAHLTALLRRDLQRALTESGFTAITFFFTNYGVVPRITFLTWQQLSGGLLTGLRFSDTIGCIARRTSHE